MSRECSRCGLTAGDLPDGVGFEDEVVLAEFFEGGLCQGCRAAQEWGSAAPWEEATWD